MLSRITIVYSYKKFKKGTLYLESYFSWAVVMFKCIYSLLKSIEREREREKERERERKKDRLKERMNVRKIV